MGGKMLTTSPHLYIRQPSPTTSEFVVTTRPRLTIPIRIALTAVFLCRCLLAAAVVVLLSAEWNVFKTTHYTAKDGVVNNDTAGGAATADSDIEFLLHVLNASPLGQSAAQVASLTPAWVVLAICAVLSYVTLLPLHTTESLLVLRGLGIQTYTSGPTSLSGPSSLTASYDTASSGRFSLSRFLGGQRMSTAGAGGRTRFIPTEKIRDVLINEAFKGFEVRYCLVVIVEGEEDLVVIFPKLLPGKRIVEEVWRGVRACLYEPDGPRKVEEKG
jgi:phosphatidylinositol N-acetylglucosaminyltransferase subunit H